jgi:DNA-binding MarR family transcriptional regulator
MSYSNKLGALGLLITDAIDEALGGSSRSAAALLLTLHYRPGITVTQLADVAGIAQPTAVRVLDGLTGRGWLERQPRVGRMTPLVLTEEGTARARLVQAARLRAMERLLASLPDHDREAFERGIDSILAGATTSRTFARTTCRLCDHPACMEPDCPIGTRATEIER